MSIFLGSERVPVDTIEWSSGLQFAGVITFTMADAGRGRALATGLAPLKKS